MSDAALIGMRRAAQRVGAKVRRLQRIMIMASGGLGVLPARLGQCVSATCMVSSVTAVFLDSPVV